MNRSDDSALTEAVAQKAALRAQKVAQQEAGVRRWLRNNPGDALRTCQLATCAPLPMVQRLAEEMGHTGLTKYPRTRRFRAAKERVTG